MSPFTSGTGWPSPSPRQYLLFVMSVRVLNAVFFLVTAVYGILCSVPFAYHQFIEPRLWKWPSHFVENHHYLYWACLLLTLLTLRRRGSWALMGLQATYVVAALAAGRHLLTWPVLLMAEGTPRGLLVGSAALLFPAVAAVIDLVALNPRLARQTFDRRLVKVSVLSAAVIVATYAAIAGTHFFKTDSGSTPYVFALGVAASLVTHVSLFLIPVGLLALISTKKSQPGLHPWLQYTVMLAGLAAALTTLVAVHVLPALTFTGWTGIAVSVLLGVTLTLTWASLAAAWSCAHHSTPIEPLDLLLARSASGSARGRWLALPGVLLIGVLAGMAVAQNDWDFTVQGLIVAVVWFATWATAYRIGWRRDDTDSASSARPTKPRTRTWAVVAGCIVVGLFAEREVLTSDSLPTVRLALDDYAQADQSFRIITRFLAWKTTHETADFYRFLQANTNIAHVDVAPIEVDFGVHAGRLETRPQPPNIFLFVVDSLRPDYLGAYNSAATFTPAIDVFAGESLVFRRAFSRYGATAMAVPSIWTGGMTLHMQYLKPYWPMNALDRLLASGHYTRRISVDPITARLMPPTSPVERLDKGRPVAQYRLCTTLAELQQRMGASVAGEPPTFVFTLPQDVHISTSLALPVPVGESYPGFVPQVAAQVHKIDGCFGDFINFLKTTHRYENSIVILTSDHGDSLGEEGRWGHAYTLYPEVVRVPLIVHVPANHRYYADTSRLAFSADIVPTLYEMLGATPHYLGPLYGSPRITMNEPPRDRSRDRFLMASSYGPVYGLLSDDGRRYYVSNAVTGRELAYDMSDPAHARELAVSADMRRDNWTAIRSHVETLGSFYGFTRH